MSSTDHLWRDVSLVRPGKALYPDLCFSFIGGVSFGDFLFFLLAE